MGIESGGEATFWAIVVAGGTLAVNFAVAIGNGITTLNRARKETDEKIDVKDRQVTEELIALERRFKNDIEMTSRNIGEAIMAIRAKVTELELWGRDHHVDKPTFQAFASETRRNWERFEEKLDKRLDWIEKKIDRNSSRIEDK